MIKIENLCKKFDDFEVLKNVSLSLEEGKVAVLIGPSGSGKSTFLRCINFLERANKGTIKIDNCTVNCETANKKEINQLRSLTSMVFQNYCLFLNKTALENIMEPMVSVQKLNKNEAKEKAMDIIKSIGLLDKQNNYPTQLSGGQQQRIGIGRAMAVNSKLMLIDEPTSSLDPELVGEVLKLLYELAKEKTTMIIATHEMKFAKHIADKVIFIDNGEIIEEGSAEEIFDNPKSERLKKFLNKFQVK
ncbi:amino acid ABC transporter ATP-binding protein [Fenollaria timonensis]|uniref:amino acid ABC transporter ATP-binding protein n=1 Tax=Fenollaria timonensis TaxID=1723384 RepID=UPI00071CDBBA|nr:amino acid ABC transporter ATP-binding protein [Fenollaria timonensis]